MAQKTQIDLIKLDSAKDQASSSSIKEEAKTSSGEAREGMPKSKLSKKFIFLSGIVGLLFLAGAGAAGYLGYISIPGFSQGKKPETAVTEQKEVGQTLKLSPLIVNLKEESGRNYLKATIVLEIDKKEKLEEIKSRMSSLVDIAILTLSDKQLEDMKLSDSKELLKLELLTKINEQLEPKRIKQIYFDEFLYQ